MKRSVMRPLAVSAILVGVALLTTGCPEKDRGGEAGKLLEDASFGRRVFRPPPPDPVRAVPPHNIHRNGVGPYELAASLQTTLALLPNGPRVELFEADGLFDYRLMRSEGDALLLGVGRRGGVAFIAVLNPDIARTESGIGVGAGVQELIGALGALKAPENQGRDSRIITFTALPDTRFIVEKGKVVAAVVMPSTSPEAALGAALPEVPEPPVVNASTCKASILEERRAELTELTKSSRFAEDESGPVSVHLACLNGERGGALVRRGEAIGWVVEDEKTGELRVQASAVVPGLSFATTLDTGGAWPEIYSLSESRSPVLREVVLTRYALTGNKLVANLSRVAFSLEATTASWIGARLQTADFLLELTGRKGAVAVGGIYMERSKGLLRHVVPINLIELPMAVVRDVRKSATDAGTLDTGSRNTPADAGPKSSKP